MSQVVLATAGYDHTIRFWEATSGICYRTLQYADSQVRSLVFFFRNADAADGDDDDDDGERKTLSLSLSRTHQLSSLASSNLPFFFLFLFHRSTSSRSRRISSCSLHEATLT